MGASAASGLPDATAASWLPEATSGKGTVFTFTINRHPYNPAVPLPYVIAIVELPEQEGLRFTTNIVHCAPEDVTIGMPVRVLFEQYDEIYVPVFEPDRRRLRPAHLVVIDDRRRPKCSLVPTGCSRVPAGIHRPVGVPARTVRRRARMGPQPAWIRRARRLDRIPGTGRRSSEGGGRATERPRVQRDRRRSVRGDRPRITAARTRSSGTSRGCSPARRKWCQLFSEPGSGSDLASLATRAVRDGDEWVVNGQKVWTSGAQNASYALLLARTDPDAEKHAGLTAFVIDMHAPGVEVRPLRQMNGGADFSEVFIADVRIPDSERLGDVGTGWAVSHHTLVQERYNMPRIPNRGEGQISAVMRAWEQRARQVVGDGARAQGPPHAALDRGRGAASAPGRAPVRCVPQAGAGPRVRSASSAPRSSAAGWPSSRRRCSGPTHC